MELTLYQVDAFDTGTPFSGNPAAVVPLEDWLPDETLQGIAAENNLAETAYFKKNGAGYDLRWFTPALEVALCGHATLASGYVIAKHVDPTVERIVFSSRSGPLSVTRQGEAFELDFPAWPAKEASAGEANAIAGALRASPRSALRATMAMAVFGRESEVRALNPDFAALNALEAGAVIATAPGDSVDFVSRVFAPKAGIPEDSVTGSAHCALAPYWAKRLGKNKLGARQISPRGGALVVTLRGERVGIAGSVRPYLEGRILV